MNNTSKISILTTIALTGCLLLWTYHKKHVSPPEKPIVLIIPSYNNHLWCERNIESILNQQYKNYHVIYLDDCSSDDTFARVNACIKKHGAEDRVTLIHNFERVGALANIYHGIQSCDDHDIVITVDGDDWLPHPFVLSIINKTYADKNVWATYGQYIDYPLQRRGFSRPFPPFYITHNAFRFYSYEPMREFPVMHLRTFYGFLGKAVREEDLHYNGSFYQMSGDKALMAPIIEMAAEHARCIPDYLYVYNTANQLNDYKTDVRLQMRLHYHILRQEPYAPLEHEMPA